MQCRAVRPSCSSSLSVQSTHRPAGGKNVPRPAFGVKRCEGDRNNNNHDYDDYYYYYYYYDHDDY